MGEHGGWRFTWIIWEMVRVGPGKPRKIYVQLRKRWWISAFPSTWNFILCLLLSTAKGVFSKSFHRVGWLVTDHPIPPCLGRWSNKDTSFVVSVFFWQIKVNPSGLYFFVNAKTISWVYSQPHNMALGIILTQPIGKPLNFEGFHICTNK